MGRADDAARRADLAAQQARIESAEAQKLIDRFLVDVADAGIAPVPIKISLPSGASVRTDREGWYLKRNHSLAIGTDGGYYQLSLIAIGWRERLKGVRLTPTPPPLIVSRGGRDGETGYLTEFLAWILDGTLR